MPKFRAIHVDHYMCKPVAPFDDFRSDITNKPISKVPIIRIFGADSVGRKICIHIHGFYPYVAIQNKDPDDPDYEKRIIADVEKAVGEVFDEKRREQQDAHLTRQPSNESVGIPQDENNGLGPRVGHFYQDRAYSDSGLSADQRTPIHRIESISTHNYYGYHDRPEPFFKIYLYNPRMVKQLLAIFESCKVLGRFVPVFWAHLPYILLFFIDNNLRGMQFIELEQLYWRKNKAPTSRGSQTLSHMGLEQEFSSASAGRQDQEFIDETERFTTDIEATSTCELEADARFEWIVNRQKFGADGNDDALKQLWLDDQEETQAIGRVESRLPLFDIEKNYVQQLCDSYEIEHQDLDLAITDRERPSQEVNPTLGLSDDSGDGALIDRDDLMPERSPDPATPEKNKNWRTPLPAADEEDFSDDEDFIKNFRMIENVRPNRSASGATPQVSRTPDANTSKTEAEDEEFSDDEEFIKNVIRLEKTLKGCSDNSMIDGRSMLTSTNRTRSGSQRSAGSSREAVSHEYQYLCIMSMELHISTRGKLRPNPAYDPIEAAFYCVRNDTPETSSTTSQVIGIVITDPFRSKDKPNVDNVRSPSARSNMSIVHQLRSLLQKTGLSLNDVEIGVVDNELELIMTLVELVRNYDPEILIGYEMEQLSWGYLLDRATKLNINVSTPLSRITDPNLGNNSKIVESTFVQPIMFTGRMVFSTWRIIRHEINLNTCSYERIHEHALNERIPCFSFETLTGWFNQNRNRWRVIDYYLIRVVGQMRILDKFDLITKVSELARVYGTQFIDVITRGSQIGIESMMLRLAKLQNLTPLSPTVSQRNKMKAPEALPLVMEPETNIYYDPVAVLDFQSLYPSVVIAYNYCFSTCLGRVSDLETKERHNFGCSQLHVREDEIKRLLRSNSIHVSPCGVAYVKKNIRHGILPKMLNELIVTRAMVKDQMKKNKKSERPNRRLQRILEHRQHGLKMMANTTYGYTGASYTGRMPCVEIADSIVSKGRETLENAIELVESRFEWGAKVIYGDTDSIFIQFANCDKETAFKRAYEMVDAITAANPHPIKMKFEKIYQPCVLQTKKRYCGFKFEAPEQTRPEFEAKGIETVRRDCCPAAARMLEMALRIQFTTRDVNEVRKYVQHQFVKIMSGKLSNIQDFIFARQYKPRDLEKTESVFVPAWQITKRLLASDPRAEPRFNERVPFVIIYGEPRTPLVNLAKTPMEVLENLTYRVNADYYIQKIICPTLNRIFCTMKVDTLLWYKSMPHQNIIHRSHYLVAQHYQRFGGAGPSSKQSTMSQYFSPSHCPVCAKSIPLNDDICHGCRVNLQSSVTRLTEEIDRNQRKLSAHHQICRACSSLERSDNPGDDYHNPCISYDCQNLFRYHQAKLDALNSNFLSMILKSLN